MRVEYKYHFQDLDQARRVSTGHLKFVKENLGLEERDVDTMNAYCDLEIEAGNVSPFSIVHLHFFNDPHDYIEGWARDFHVSKNRIRFAVDSIIASLAAKEFVRHHTN